MMVVSCLLLLYTIARAPCSRPVPLPPTKQKIPRQMSEDFYGGELGTRTPDPLRVMHDDFSFFGTMIR